MAILNIILHGLLFLELKSTTTSSWLEITAPNLQTNHDLWMGVPGNLQNINGQTISWAQLPGLNGGSPGKLIGGIPMDVPDQIYQFGRIETEVGDINPQGNQGIIRLPWPSQWRTIRLGNRPNLTTRLPQKSLNKQVHTCIENRCNNVIGVATVLTYDYALSLPPTSDNFDLAMVDLGSSSNTSTPIGQMRYPEHSGLSIGDEISLNEVTRVIDPTAVDNVEVKDAIVKLQLFLLTLPPIIFDPDDTRLVHGALRQSADSLYKTDQIDGLKSSNIFMASPANCPLFFLGT